ncbi:MAG: oxygen-independent coproporphyrinogen III oxidase [Pseudomonadota bacterium]|nr:oxygen-independent coproporphyrinogen III oxidase [Pseudomonadota bacterium]
MHTPLSPPTELLRRYDQPGPRYTSYPTAPQFCASFDEDALRQVIAHSNGDPVPRQLSLYVHVPYCQSPCFYCGCNRIISRDRSKSAPYIDRLGREIGMMAALFDRDREVIQLHFGGGTPNFFSPAELRDIVDEMRSQLRFSDAPDRDISIELDPRFVTPAEIAELASIGFNRASLGVQDFDAGVQKAINRIQGIEETRAIIEACRAHGFASVNIDLIYGLPKQTAEGFANTLDSVIALRPDRLAVYSYAHLPELFRPQRQLNAFDLPTAEEKIALLRLAIEKLTNAGYVYIGMDHFALPDDELALAQARGSLHRNFMGYTTHADSDLIGFGVSSISHIGQSFSQNPRTLPEWEAAIDAGRLPVWRGLAMSEDDSLRADIIQQWMCHGRIDKAQFERHYDIDFDAYFADAIERLAPLQADGLVQLDPAQIRATAQGRWLLRNAAMCFDAYLGAKTATRPAYSKAI